MLPHDNKSEVQVVVDMPEGTTLEHTAAAARELAGGAAALPEVTDVQIYAGTSAPFNFNGLVRHYFLRSGPTVADLQVNLLLEARPDRASHPFAKVAASRSCAPIAERHGANVKVTEVPPGPPVLSTLVAEIYAPELDERVAIAEEVKADLRGDGGSRRCRLVRRGGRAAARPRGRPGEGGARRRLPRGGRAHAAGRAGRAPAAISARPVDPASRCRAAAARAKPALQRSRICSALEVHGADGRLVPLRELVRPRDDDAGALHLPQEPAAGDLRGRRGGGRRGVAGLRDARHEGAHRAMKGPDPDALEFSSRGSPRTPRPTLKWDGEWQITYEVFRDMGIAFAVVLVLIYLLVVGWFRSFVTPLIIMAPIPLTLIGILPAHGIFGVFFTATSMIGFIALAGIIVRNSILLVDFVNLELERGEPLEDAVIRAGAVRFRPIALTAAALVVGGGVILLDPSSRVWRWP
jgi:multidrug efflux pump subunit AcrB